MYEKKYVDGAGLKRFKDNLDTLYAKVGEALSPEQAEKLENLVFVKEIGAGLSIDQDGTLVATQGGKADTVDWTGVADKPSTLEGYGITDAASLEDIERLEGKLEAVYHFKGSVEDLAELLTIQNPEVGDVYNIKATGMNAGWTGTEWDEFGTVADLTGLLKEEDVDRVTEEEIDAMFGRYTVRDLAKMYAVLAQGGTIALEEDVTLDETKTDRSDRNYIEGDVELNLGDHVIIMPATYNTSAGNWSAMWIGNDATMVVNAENGGIQLAPGTDNDGGPFCFTVGSADKAQCGKLVINGGNYKAGSDCVYVMCGEAEIYDGYFEVTPDKDAVREGYGGPYDYLLNCYDKNFASGDARITVYGGTYVNFNPAQAPSEAGHPSFLAPGRHVEQRVEGENTIYTVVKD